MGNIFPLGKWYAEKMKVNYVSENGEKKPVWFASYGIGPTRVMGALVEVSHDEKGIVWNKDVAPFDMHLIELKADGSKQKAKNIYQKIIEKGFDVLWDDRDVSAGQKFSDADLIGIPVRLVVSGKTGDNIEWKERASKNVELLTVDEVLVKLLK